MALDSYGVSEIARGDGWISPDARVGQPPEHRDHRNQFGVGVVVDPTAVLEAFVTVDSGVQQPTTIGARVWLMKHVHVGHDAQIGDDCEIAPHTSVGGHAELGPKVRVGQAAVFKPFVIVGPGARIGMGAVVIRNVPPGEVWAGNPARQIRQQQQQRERDPDMDDAEYAAWEEWWERRTTNWPPSD